MKVGVIFAYGTEEIEAITPIDVLRRAGVDCDIISVSGEYPIGSHGITVKADKVIEETDLSIYDAIVIPGGMPGAINISNNQKVIDAVKDAIENNKVVGAICASPAVVLAKHNLIDGKSVTCYPAKDFIKMLKNSIFTNKSVQRDGNIVTANGPKSAMEFSLLICDALNINAKF